MEIKLIQGGLHTDSRGTLTFINDFDVKCADRFYTIRAHRFGEPRGWVGHQIEHKWFIALSGSVLIAVVKPDHWKTPSPTLPVQRVTLSALKPAMLHVPLPISNAYGRSWLRKVPGIIIRFMRCLEVFSFEF